MRHAGIVETLGQLETDGGRRNAGLAQVLDDLFEEMVAVLDQPHIEIEEQRRGGEIRQAGEFRQSPCRHHLLESEKLSTILRLIEQFERRGKTEALMTAQE